MSFLVLENVITSTSTMKKASSGLRLRSGNAGSQRGSRRSRRRRQQSRPVRIKKRGGPVLHGDCLDLIPTLEDESVSLVVTSPPYAEQRAGHYEGIPEEDYPDFTVQWMDRPCAQDDARWIGSHRDPPPSSGWRPFRLRAADPSGFEGRRMARNAILGYDRFCEYRMLLQ